VVQPQPRGPLVLRAGHRRRADHGGDHRGDRLSIAREREVGTFEQLLVTPLRPLEILVGKAAPALRLGWPKDR
jgi:hypothetical protein